MDFTNIKDMSIGNLKIKEIWYNNNILYQDSKPVGLYTVQLIANSSTRVIIPIKYQVTTELNTIKLGGV